MKKIYFYFLLLLILTSTRFAKPFKGYRDTIATGEIKFEDNSTVNKKYRLIPNIGMFESNTVYDVLPENIEMIGYVFE